MKEIIIQIINEKLQIIVLEDDKIAEYYSYDTNNLPKVGNIYLGKVKDVKPKTNTVFIDIGLPKAGFLQLKSIDKKYKKGDMILVQVKKDETNSKGAKLSNNIDFKYDDIFNNRVGLVFDANNLVNKIIDTFNKEDIKKIYINDKKIYSDINKQIKSNKNTLPKLVYKETNFLDEFGLLTDFEKINARKIWLKSGGYLTIDKTEALTAIDINSGKYTGKKDDKKEDVVFCINKEAAYEAAKQIRLKNIGGIIVVDFINMTEKGHKDDILRILKEESAKDRSIVEIYGFTRLGLVEVARKKL